MADAVLSLADLDHGPFAGTALAVLGQPIKHSISPALHHAALAVMAEADPRFRDWRYFRFEVAPADLPLALRRLYDRGFLGLNLTVPHKVLAVSAVAALDPAAAAIGAVNTLLRTPDGWKGFNTDGHGLAAGIREDLGLAIAGRDILLLGAGGAARGAAVECLRRGCRSLWIGNRTAENLQRLMADLAPARGATPVHGFSPASVPSELPVEALLINATSAGLRSGDAVPIDLAALPRPAAVYDMIYNPPQTELLATAARLGIPQANGLSMLVHQGARALEIWSGVSVPVAAMRRAAEQTRS